MLGITGVALSVACFFYDGREQEALQTLTRPEQGEGDQEQKLQAELGGKRYPLEITLVEMPCSEEEIHEILTAASAGLEKMFLKNNTDLYHIKTDIQMPSVIPDTEVEVQWYLDSWEYVDPDGTVRNESLKEPVPLKVQAVLSLGDRSVTWKRDLKLCPPGEPDTEQKMRLLEYQIQERQKDDSSGELLLPSEVFGEPVSWYQTTDRRGIWMLALTVCSLAAVEIGRRREEEQSARKRERSMQLDYPEIVSRLSLYMGAGISTRKAWERIVENYEKKNGESTEHRAAYEEMRKTLHEMQSGIPETLAYERFGTRCRVPAYLKLGTLLSQNLRKGTRNLAELLREEAREAFEDRKALARRMGEECESKLLLPMGMLLLTVLIMVMYPALVSF